MLLASFTVRPMSTLLRHARRSVALVVTAAKHVATVWQHRREVARLAELSPHELKDIGLSRSDVLGALEGHWLDDPSLALAARSDAIHDVAALRREPVHTAAAMPIGSSGTGTAIAANCIPHCT